jgi:hypothetical protein
MTSRSVAFESRTIPHPIIAATAIPINRPTDGLSPCAHMTISTTANSRKKAVAVRNINPPITENMACVLVWFLDVLIVVSFIEL